MFLVQPILTWPAAIRKAIGSLAGVHGHHCPVSFFIALEFAKAQAVLLQDVVERFYMGNHVRCFCRNTFVCDAISPAELFKNGTGKLGTIILADYRQRQQAKTVALSF